MAKPPPWYSKDVVLGWKVTKALEPQHWSTKRSKPGKHKPTDLVVSEPKSIARHTVIVAQSGSGKSFFLGRLVEEIALKTRSRVLILDMNADFRKIADAQDSKNWKTAKYDKDKRTGFLVEEPSRAAFTTRWKKISKKIHTNRSRGSAIETPLVLNWIDFPADLLAGDADARYRDELRHCHKLVGMLAEFAKQTKATEWLEPSEFLGVAFRFCCKIQSLRGEEVLRAFVDEFGPVDDPLERFQQSQLAAGDETVVALPNPRPNLAGAFWRQALATNSDESLDYRQAAMHAGFVSKKWQKFYFARASALASSKLVRVNIGGRQESHRPKRIEVVDLPSIEDPWHQKLAMCVFLESEWRRARRNWERALSAAKEKDNRVPTFIVVEEAHNALPDKTATPTDEKLLELFRRIAAEGRKFGLFLILVSQRPDKLDRMVLSECENRAVMKVGSNFVLRTTCEVLGLDSVVARTTDKVLEFDVGRALLAGPWVSDDSTLMVAAARRTEEGGRDLQPKRWARPQSGLI